MPKVTQEAHKDGDCFVDYESKVFEDVKADPGDKALVTFHKPVSGSTHAIST